MIPRNPGSASPLELPTAAPRVAPAADRHTGSRPAQRPPSARADRECRIASRHSNRPASQNDAPPRLLLLLRLGLFGVEQLLQRGATEVGAAGLLIGMREGQQIGLAEQLAREGDGGGLVVRALVARAVGNDRRGMPRQVRE